MKDLVEWTRTVKQRDGHVCRKCGITRNLEAHHIIPKGKSPEFELELENGVTLCGNCHTLLKGREETEDMKKFLLDDAKIGKQLAALVKLIEPRLDLVMMEFNELILKLTDSRECIKQSMDDLNPILEKIEQYAGTLNHLSKSGAINSERTESGTVISKIRLDYYDEDGISRTLTKCIYETWNPEIEQWHLKKIEYLFDDSELPVSSDNIEAAAHTRDGRLIPSEWIFDGQEFVCVRQPIEIKQRGYTYDHESDVLVKGK